MSALLKSECHSGGRSLCARLPVAGSKPACAVCTNDEGVDISRATGLLLPGSSDDDDDEPPLPPPPPVVPPAPLSELPVLPPPGLEEPNKRASKPAFFFSGFTTLPGAGMCSRTLIKN